MPSSGVSFLIWVGNPGTRALDMFEIGRPDLDWAQLAKGMGVPGTRVNSRWMRSEKRYGQDWKGRPNIDLSAVMSA